LQYLLGAAGTLLFLVTSILLKGLITKLEDGNKILYELRVDIAVIKQQWENYSKRVSELEGEIKFLKNELADVKSKIK